MVLDNPAPSKEDKRFAKVQLKAWARGFNKNRPGAPFLISEKWRAMFFPKTETRFVWSATPAPPVPPVSEEVAITLSHLDVNNEEMIDLMK